MIFFREHRVLVRFQKNPETIPQGFFVRIRADFEGSVHPLSGMVLNLKDVDEGLQKVFQKARVYRSRRDCLLDLGKSLEHLFPRHFQSLSLKTETSALTWNRFGRFTYAYNCSTQLQTEYGLQEHLVRLTSDAPIRLVWLQKLRRQNWSHIHECVKALKNLKAPLIDVEIERPELGGWEKWHLKDS